MQNLTIIASAVPQIIWGPRNLKLAT